MAHRRAGQKWAFFKLYLSDTPACAIFLPYRPSLRSRPSAGLAGTGRAARGSKLRLGEYGGRRGGGDRDRTRRGDPGNEGMRAALLIRVYLPLHSCLHRETSVALTLAGARARARFFLLFISSAPIKKFPALFRRWYRGHAAVDGSPAREESKRDPSPALKTENPARRREGCRLNGRVSLPIGGSIPQYPVA